MENKLRESEARFKTIMASMQDTVFTLDREQRHTGVYGPWVEQQGFTPIDFLGKTAREIMGEETASIHEKANEQALKGEFVVYEWSVSADKKTLYYQTSLSPIFGENGKVEGLVGVGRNITELKQAEDKLKLLSHSIQQNPVSIIITDKEGKIEYVNPAFCDHTGYETEEVIGKNPKILNSGYHPESFFAELWDTILSGKNWRNEIKNKKKNGELFWEDVVISPILNEKNEINHFTSIRENVTEKKKMIKDLILEKERAEMSDKLKSVFLANMSHEIRTPMNGIMGFIDLLQKQDLNRDTRTNYLNIIRKSSLRLLNTLNDIIEISKIEAGQVGLLEENFHLSGVLQYFYDFHKLEARQKGLTFLLKNDLTPDTDLIKADKHKMESILDNFIKNAIKFTSDGSIEMGSEIRGGKLVLYVRDTGSGIPVDRLESIFERFVQADLMTTKAYEGSGLGLAICKAYADMLGGTVSVESKVGKGSVFYFTLPLDKKDELADEQEDINQPVTSSDKAFEGLTVLIAEDDALSVLYLKALLEEQCKTLLVAGTGNRAIEKVRDNPNIDLVLMDVSMPVMSGTDTLKLIRGRYPDLKVVAQSAHALRGDRERFLGEG
ncbi:MAG: PAS domain S-box protein, partial [Thermovirgaceae bacterium]|nr:PAS domain S-box protein [Thermovirgaceae bacterium]